MERKIPGSDYPSETKNKILDTATEYFALKGFHTIAMRGLAKTVGVASPTLYHHYESKEALMEDIFSRFEKGYRNYIEWQWELNSKAETLEEVMDNLFNDEFLGMKDTIGHFGISLVINEQHRFERARQLAFELFHDLTINRLQKTFDRLIENGVIPPSDTKTVATFFMFTVLNGNEMRLHELQGHKPPIDCNEMYINAKKHMTSVLKRG